MDHRADIYSLGVVFCEMLTGEVPMGRFEPPSKRVQIDVRLDEVVLKALEREPERRYQRAGLVKSDVETIVTTPHPFAHPKRPLSERIAFACAALFLFGLGAQFFIQSGLGSIVNGALAFAIGLGTIGSLAFVLVSAIARLRGRGRWLAGTPYAAGTLMLSLALIVFLTLAGGIFRLGSKAWRLQRTGESNPEKTSIHNGTAGQDSDRLFEDLHDPAIEVRERAEQELVKRGRKVEAEVRSRLQKTTDAEPRERLERILQEIENNRWKEWSLVRTISPHGGVTLTFALSPDENSVATLGDDDAVCVWDARTGREMARLPHGLPSNWTRTLEFSPDSKLLAVGGGKKALLFDCATWRRTDEWTLEDGCGSFAFSKDAVLVRGLNGTLTIRRAAQTLTYSGDTARISDFLALGDRIVLLRLGGVWSNRNKSWLVAELVRMDRMEVTASARLDREGPSGSSSSFFRHAQLSPDGTSVLYVEDGKVAVHEIATDRETRRFADGVEAARLSPDGARVAVSRNGAIETWDPDKGERIATLAKRDAKDFRWSPAGDRLIVHGEAASLFDVVTGREVCSTAARRASFSSDGRIACLWEPEGDVHVVEATSGAEITTRRVKSVYFYSATYPARCALSSRGAHFAALVDGSLALYDLAGRGHAANVGALRITPDGRRLVTFSKGPEEAKIVEVDSGRETFAIPAGTWDETPTLSPDGQALLTRSPEGLWQVSGVPSGWKTLEIESRRKVSRAGRLQSGRILDRRRIGTNALSRETNWRPCRGRPILSGRASLSSLQRRARRGVSLCYDRGSRRGVLPADLRIRRAESSVRRAREHRGGLASPGPRGRGKTRRGGSGSGDRLLQRRPEGRRHGRSTGLRVATRGVSKRYFVVLLTRFSATLPASRLLPFQPPISQRMPPASRSRGYGTHDFIRK